MRFLKSRLGIVGELLQFLWDRKLWWIIPVIVTLLLLGGLLILAGSALFAPFFNRLF
jgi:hypothetical protein